MNGTFFFFFSRPDMKDSFLVFVLIENKKHFVCWVCDQTGARRVVYHSVF